MKKAASVAALLICLLASCAAPEMVPPPQPTALPPTRAVQVVTVVHTAVPTAPPTSKPASTAVSTATPTASSAGLRLAAGGLTVIIEAPQDGATLSTSPVAFKGTAPAGAVISLNELNLVVGSSGVFSASIELDPGPNLVEFLASNAKGDQVTYFFTVFYDP